MIRKIASMLLALCLLNALCGARLQPAAQAEGKTVYIVSTTLNAYKKADTSSKVLGVMSYGEKMTCVAVSGKWARIKNSGGSIAYCAKACLSTKNPNTLNAKAYAKSSGVKVYKKPSTSSGVITKLKANACCTAIAMTKDGKWLRLKNGSRYGYVQTASMSKQKLKSSSGTASKASAVVKLADKLRGKPYAYATRGPNSFDCSGFAYYVYKNAAGVSLKRTASQQASDGRFSKIKSPGSLKAGDLLCFDIEDSGSCSHVAVYVGGGKFVHASSSAGKVLVSSFTSYYKDKFMYARRIV